MTFHWRMTPPNAYRAPDTASPEDVAVADPASFSTQGDAETWLGEHWRSMASAGVTAVTLVDGTKPLYDMSLEPGP
jgi:hypothetical protein